MNGLKQRPHVVDVTHEWDNTSAIWLRKLMGDTFTRRLGSDEHPLGGGFAALRAAEAGDELDEGARNALSNLKLLGLTLHQLRRSWKASSHRIVDDLGDAKQCESLLFELQVARVLFGGGSNRLVWNRYEEGAPDLVLRRPKVAIECKLLRSEHRSHFEVLRSAARQHRDLGMPLVVALGVSWRMSTAQRAGLDDAIVDWKGWFESHDHVAAGAIFVPREIPTATVEITGRAGQFFDFGSVMIVRSYGAKPPLPQQFSFRGEDRRTERPIGRTQP